MGRRALIAYARDDGDQSARGGRRDVPCTDTRYDVYYAHWAGADLSLAGFLDDPATDPVAIDAVATDVAFSAVVDHVEAPVHEALYVVDPDTVRTYRVLWLGPLGVDGSLLVGVDWQQPCDDAHVCAWVRGARAVAAACRERERLSPTEAVDVLSAELRAWADDRDVICRPRRSR